MELSTLDYQTLTYLNDIYQRASFGHGCCAPEEKTARRWRSELRRNCKGALAVLPPSLETYLFQTLSGTEFFHCLEQVPTTLQARNNAYMQQLQAQFPSLSRAAWEGLILPYDVGAAFQRETDGKTKLLCYDWGFFRQSLHFSELHLLVDGVQRDDRLPLFRYRHLSALLGGFRRPYGKGEARHRDRCH